MNEDRVFGVVYLRVPGQPAVAISYMQGVETPPDDVKRGVEAMLEDVSGDDIAYWIEWIPANLN